MKSGRALLPVVILVAIGTAVHSQERPGALPDLRIARGDKNIAEAWLADPTTRYDHFVLGSRYEAASLVVRLRDGATLKLTLPDDQVFEDRQPRLADLDGDGRNEIVLVHTDVKRGSSLAVIGVRDGALRIVAETPPTGAPHRWLNPVGIADFDGDGRLDIAYVEQPHVLGKLHVVTLRDGMLAEIGTIGDTANHVIHTPYLGMSAIADFDGDGVADIAIPSLDRSALRFLSFKGGAHEIKRMVYPQLFLGDFKLLHADDGGPVIEVTLGDGEVRLVGF